jgi:hypothetical protein
MKKMRKFIILAAVGIIGFLTHAACIPPGGALTPSSFVQVIEPTWSTIEIKADMTYDRAWQEVVDVVAKRFEMEMISKEGGYLRTSWIYTWWKEGIVTENYRVRVIIKFSADQKKVDMKTEANFMLTAPETGRSTGNWVVGTDTKLLQTLKTDIMGVVGRTTR